MFSLQSIHTSYPKVVGRLNFFLSTYPIKAANNFVGLVISNNTACGIMVVFSHLAKKQK